MSRMTKHVSKAGKVDPGDRVTLPVKFACKPTSSPARALFPGIGGRQTSKVREKRPGDEVACKPELTLTRLLG